MTSTGIVLMLIGLFVIVNSQNFVGVLQGHLKISNTTKATTSQSQTQTSGQPAPMVQPGQSKTLM